MAEYKIKLGTQLDTSGIDGDLRGYKGKVTVKSDLDKSGIDTAINTYTPPKVIEVKSKLLSKGITDVINKYKNSKTIKVLSELDYSGIDKGIDNYSTDKVITLNVNLNPKSINDEISKFNGGENKPSIELNANLNKNAIRTAINDFNKELNAIENGTNKNDIKIKIKAEPIFDGVDSKIANYTPRSLMKINAKVNKGQIDQSIKDFKTSASIKINNVQLTESAIKKAMTLYNPESPVPVKIDFILGDVGTVDAKIKSYKEVAIDIPVNLAPASKDYASKISNTPVKVSATVDKDTVRKSIEGAIGGYTPSAKMTVNIKPSMPRDINAQIRELPKPTESIEVGVRFDGKKINEDIALFQPTATLGIKPDLIIEDTEDQIAAYVPKAKLRINVDLNDENINAELKNGKNGQSPITVNVKLNREKLNEDIEKFKPRSKLNVKIKLNPEGLAKQLKEIKLEDTEKVKVNAELDRESIKSDILSFKPDTPIKLDVELNMENARADIESLKSEFQKFGKIEIHFPNANVGNSTVRGNGSGSGGNVQSNAKQQFREIDIAVSATTDQVKNLKNALQDVGFNKSSIKTITKDFSDLGISVKNVTSRLQEDGTVTLTVKGIDQFERAVTVMKEVNSSGEITNLGTTISQDFNETENAFKRLKSLGKEISNLDIKIAGLDTKNNSQEVKTLTGQLKNLKKEYSNLFNITSKNLSTSQLDKLSQDIANSSNKIDAIKSKIADAKAALSKKMSEEIQFKIDTKDFDKDISNIESKVRNFGNVSKELKKDITQLKSNKTQMTNALASGDIEKAIRAYERYLEILERIDNEIKISKNQQKVVDIDFGKLERLKTEIDSIQKKIAKLDPKVNTEQLDVLSRTLKDLESDYDDLYNKLKNNLSTSQTDKLTESAAKAQRELDELKAKIADAKKALADKIQLKLDDGTFANQVDNVTTKIGKLKEETPEIAIAMDNVNSALKRMGAALQDGDVEGAISAYRDYENALKSVKNQLDINARAEKTNAENLKLADDRVAFQSKIDAWLTKNSAAAKKFGAQLLELKAQAENCDRTTLDHLEREFKQIDQQAEAAGKRMQTFGDRLKSQFQKYSSYLSVASVIMYATQAARNMFEQVKLIDSAMTELKKVTDETSESYNQFLKNAASRSKELGTTIDGLVASTADFARLGYGFEESQGLAEVANIYAVVGDEIEGVEGATESLISTLAAFKEQANGMSDTDFAMSIIDIYNELGKLIAYQHSNMLLESGYNG